MCRPPVGQHNQLTTCHRHTGSGQTCIEGHLVTVGQACSRVLLLRVYACHVQLDTSVPQGEVAHGHMAMHGR
jgi:hypothetical protein